MIDDAEFLEIIRSEREKHDLPRNHITIDEAKRSQGGKVLYRAPGGDVSEPGVITSVNDQLIFVRYLGDAHSKATRPEDLEWLYMLSPQ